MIPGTFEYHRPSTIDEVVSLLAELGDDSRVVAGGHSLIPMMKMRIAEPAHLIDLAGVGGLADIKEDGATLVIGAMVTLKQIIDSPLLAGKCPILGEAAAVIADPQVRSMGTIGGNAANGDPGNDMPAVLMALDASYVLRGPKGERSVAARGYYEGAFFTARADDEVLCAIRVPAPAAGHGYAYQKLKRKTGDYATAAAAVILAMAGGKCSGAAVALTNVGQTALLASAAASALVGTDAGEEAAAAAAAAAKAITEPVGDLRGSAAYRAQMAAVMTFRAIAAARARAAG